jgi:hypothetical protein
VSQNVIRAKITRKLIKIQVPVTIPFISGLVDGEEVAESSTTSGLDNLQFSLAKIE